MDTVTAVAEDLLELSQEQRNRLDDDPFFDRCFDYALDDAALAYQDESTTG